MVNLKDNQVAKPWGYEKLLGLNENFAWKILFIRKGERLSLQFHEKKSEEMLLTGGKAKFTLGEDVFVVSEDDDRGVIKIPPLTKHRIEALEDTVIFEVSTPELDDVVRISDDYGRANPKSQEG